MRRDINTSDLVQKYGEGYSMNELSKTYFCSITLIKNRLKSVGVSIRGHKDYKTDRVSQRIRENQTGALNSNYKGGQQTFVCAGCGKVCKSYKSTAHSLKYCSNKCQMKHAPTTKGRPCPESLKEINRKNMIKRRVNGEFSNWLGTGIERKIENWLLFNNIIYIKEYAYKLGVADFWLPESNIIIECDGDYWHSIKEKHKKDVVQTSFLENNDYVVLRFSEKKINKEFDMCVEEIVSNT